MPLKYVTNYVHLLCHSCEILKNKELWWYCGIVMLSNGNTTVLPDVMIMNDIQIIYLHSFLRYIKEYHGICIVIVLL